ncbi:MAG: hypothetical protein P1V97_32650 [Planctomycetota bacterium]|nr:hypothetical protein [Planctomycetota bacterium]
MKNKIIRLKTAGVIALPALGIFLGFFSGVSAAQALKGQTETVVMHCNHSAPQAHPVCLQHLDNTEPPEEVKSTDQWRQLIEAKIDKAMQDPTTTLPRQGIKNPDRPIKTKCVEPMICDG